MRRYIWHFAFLGWIFASATAASEIVGPRIDLRVEQPAYAGMPIWLNVAVHDGCLNKDYLGTSSVRGQFGSALGYDPWARRAEVKGPHGDIEPAGFAGPGLPAHWMTSKHLPCRAAYSGAAASMRRFPLHIAADLYQPGQYQVRWVIGRNDVLAHSAWVSFSVAPSTSVQIEAWLMDLLAHVPTDVDAIRKTSIPALLVQTVLARLSGTADISLGNSLPGILRDLGYNEDKSPEFVAAAHAALRHLFVHAQSAQVRLNAAAVLARLGDKEGMQAVLGVLRTGKFEQVAVVLDGLAGPEVSCPEAWAQCYATVSRAVDPNAKWISVRKAAAISYFSNKIKMADPVAH